MKAIISLYEYSYKHQSFFLSRFGRYDNLEIVVLSRAASQQFT